MKKWIMLILILVTASGCGFIRQSLIIDPTLNFSVSNIGQDQKVALRVLDEREDTAIGNRFAGFYRGGTITSKQDIDYLFKTWVSQGLERSGFAIEPYKDEIPVKLVVEIRNIGYNTEVGLLTGGNNAECSLKVRAENNDKTYEKMYRGRQEIRTFFVASQETNAKILNAAVSQALTNMFADESLLRFLAE